MKHRVSASVVQLAVHCGYPFRADVPVPYEKAGPAADRGTAAHKAIETYLTHGTYPAEQADPVTFALFSTWLEWWERVGDRGMVGASTELPMVLDVARGSVRMVPKAGHRDYGTVGPFEIPMTLDLAHVVDGVAIVRDWKTGKPGDPCEGQLATNAVAWALASGVREAFAQAVYITSSSVIETEPLELDAMDLDAHLDTLRRVMRTLPTAQPTPGPHCKAKWCKLREKCPAHRAYLKEERMSA